MSMNRRLRQVSIATDLLVGLFTVGDVTDIERQLECVEGLPPGAVLVDAKHDGWSRSVVLLFAHESFDELPEGASVPSMNCRFVSREIVNANESP